jgi:hypothetical protein
VRSLGGLHTQSAPSFLQQEGMPKLPHHREVLAALLCVIILSTVSIKQELSLTFAVTHG